MLLCVLMLAIGNMWGADPTHNAPATKTYAQKVFLDVAATPGNAGTDNAYLNYGVQAFKNYRSNWAWWSETGTFSSSNSSYSLPTGAVGFCTPGSSSSNEFYGYLKMISTGYSRIDMYVTGITSVGFIWANNNTSNNRWMIYEVAEVDNQGNVGTPTQEVGKTNSTSIQYAAISNLDGTKYYRVSMYTTGSSASKFNTFTFERYAAPSTYSVTYDANGATSGSVPTDANEYKSGDEVTVKGNTDLAKTGKTFEGWNTKNDGSGTHYDGGDKFDISSNTTLYAEWEDIPCTSATLSIEAEDTELSRTGSSVTTTLSKTAGANTSSVVYGVYSDNACTSIASGASISGTTFTATEGGTYYVRATQVFDGTYCATTSNVVEITVTVPVTGVSLNESSLSIAAGKSEKLTATISPDDATNKNVTWSVTGNSKVSVNTSGKVTVAADATIGSKATVTVTTQDGSFIDNCQIEVIENLEESCNYIKSGTSANNYDFEDYIIYYSSTNDAYTSTDVSGSTSNKCGDATHRMYMKGVVVYLKNTSASRIALEGQQDYDVTPVNIKVADALDGTYNSLTATNVNYTNKSCGELGISNVNIAKGKYVFIGFSGGTKNEFRISGLCVTPAPTPKTYTVTYEKGDGTGGTAPTQAAVAAGTEITLADNTFTAPSGQEFDGWLCSVDSKTYQAKESYTMTAANTTFTAQWKVATQKWTVTYKDGETTLGTETVEDGAKATKYSEYESKTLAEFKGWFNADGNTIEFATQTIDANLVAYGNWDIQYAQTADFMALAKQYGTIGQQSTSNISTVLKNNHYTIDDKTEDTGAYWDMATDHDGGLGMDNQHIFSFWVEANQKVTITVGVMQGYNANGKASLVLYDESGNTIKSEDIATESKDQEYITEEITRFVLTTPNGDTGPTSNFWNRIQKITITGTTPHNITLDPATNGSFTVKGLTEGVTAVEGENVALVANPDPHYGLKEWSVYKTGEETTKVTVNNNSFVMPAYAVTVAATFELVTSTDATLSDLKADGTTVAGFSSDKYEYNVELPYKTTDIPEVTATKNNEFASDPIISLPESLPGDAKVKVTAEDGTTTATYTIHFTVAPKDGVCIIKSVYNSSSKTSEISGLIGGTEDRSLSNSGKLDNNKYWGLTLAQGIFKAGDVVNIKSSAAADQGKVAVYNGKDLSSATALYLGDDFGTTDITITMPDEAEGVQTLYLSRNDTYNKWNPVLTEFAVYRAMNPMLTKATILGEEATINESAKTVTIEVPYSTDITAVTPAFEYVSNDNNQVTVTPTGAQDFTKAKTYRFTDKDGDYTEYEVSITKATASSDATLKSLSVDGYDLEFAAETLEYTIERAYADRDADLPEITYEVNYTAATAVKSAEGKVVTITVTAEDGTTQKEYKIEFTNAEASTDATLASLRYKYDEVETTITLVEDQFEYDVELPYGTTKVPTLIASTKYLYAHAEIKNAEAFVNYAATSTVVVTAEDGETQLTYTVNFSVDKFPNIVIFDGSTMSDMVTSPNATTGLSWAVVGSTMTASDQSGKKIVYQGISYPNALQAGNSSATKHFTITVPENYEAKIHILMMTNSSSSTRSAWITTSTDKGEKDDAIMSVTSTSYTDLGDGTTDWLKEGTYYVHTDNSINFFVLSVKMKKNAPKPIIKSITEDGTYCEGGDMPTLTVNADVDEGTMHYQWYKGTDKVGEDNASYTPSENGKYHVVITNKMDGFDDGVVTSDNIVVASVAGTVITATQGGMARANTAVTISVTATGKNLNYAWYACDKQGNVSGEMLGTKESLNVTVAADNTYYKVIVTGDCGEEQSAVIKVETVPEIAPQVSVSGTTVWDFSKAPKDAEDASNGIKSTEANQVMANISNIRLDDTFNSQALVMGNANEYAYRGSSNKCFQGKSLKFHTTVPGKVTINARLASSGTVTLKIGSTDFGEIDTKQQDYSAYVEAGDVEILATGDQTIRIFTMTFTVADHYRLGMKLEDLGTICLPNNVLVANQHGASFFKIDYQDGSFVHFIEETGELQAGMPYVFQVTGKDVALFYGEEHVDAPLSEGTNGMIGTFIDMWPADYASYFKDTYFMLNNSNHIVKCGNNCGIYANRAYFDVEGMPTSPQQIEVPAGQAAPRRLVLGRDKANTPTDLDAVFFNGNTVQKVIFNNNVRIIRNGVIYDAVGRRIK